MIVIRALTRSYGERVALNGVSLEARDGEIVGLLGANGAGKSTLLRICAGLQPPDAGVVEVDGASVWQAPDKAKRAIGYAPEEPAFYEELSADEYLAFLAAVRGLDPDEARARAGTLCARLGLAGRTDEPVARFSHGMRRKLSFIAAVLHRPSLLLCDEALEGFDAGAAIAAKKELRGLAKGGCAILFSSHVTETIERLCDRVILLHRGRVARSLARLDWGAATDASSRLEAEFLEVAREEQP